MANIGFSSLVPKVGSAATASTTAAVQFLDIDDPILQASSVVEGYSYTTVSAAQPDSAKHQSHINVQWVNNHSLC